MQVFENQALAFCLVPGAGIEPARIAPLVFETSASTDSAIRAGVLCPKTGTRRIDLLVKDCKGIGNFGNCKINDIPWTENPIELTEVELKTFYNSEYHGTLDGNIRESVQGVFAQGKMLQILTTIRVSSANNRGNWPRPHSNTHSSTQYPTKDCYICRL